jgi:lectin-like protein
MWRRTCMIPAFALATFVAVTQAQTVIDGPIKSPINGHYYSVLSNSNWTSAQAVAETMGGNLATVRSSPEETWIQTTFSAYPYLWLGFYDPSEDGNGQPHADNFVWVDGEATTYTNWDSGEPNNFDGGEYWTELVLTNSSTVTMDKWNDIINDTDPEYYPNYYGPVYGLVEVVPAPDSLGLLAICGCLLLGRWAPKLIRLTDR